MAVKWRDQEQAGRTESDWGFYVNKGRVSRVNTMTYTAYELFGYTYWAR